MGLHINNKIQNKDNQDLDTQLLTKYSNNYASVSEGAIFNRSRLKAIHLASLGSHKNSIRDFEGALNEYNKAIELYPYEPDYFQKRGGINSTLGNFDQAYSDWEKSMELANNNKSIEVALNVLIEISNKLQNNILIEKNINMLKSFKKMLDNN
jgi:tetratricopeptide (TPR) repeat protein